ncbi:uncharacterized protein PHACADRAFT_61601, partial [Phanerochaete carnosa HHB-10118-sp]
GDAVRWGPDGQLHLVGKITAGQIKIRGRRLELAEIETAIRRTGLTSDAAAVHLESDGDRDDLLIVYTVATVPVSPSESHTLSSRLLEALREILPLYMIPHLVHWVPTLPLTLNGKLDRYQLQARAVVDVGSMLNDLTEDQDASDEPEDEVEERLCRIMEAVLERTPIHRSSNFFHAGGHSLLASRLVFRIEESFSVPFTLADVF